MTPKSEVKDAGFFCESINSAAAAASPGAKPHRARQGGTAEIEADLMAATVQAVEAAKE
jgi:hypothetical protein